MQQSGNDQFKGIALVFALIGTVFWMIAIFVVIAAAFITFCLTILCLCAWEREITICGYSLAPAEARAFIERGLIGVCLSVAFVAFCVLLFNLRITQDAFCWTALAGYIVGSLGSEFVIAHRAENAASEPEILPPQIEPPSAPPTHRLPSPDAKPFRFASWDDEDVRQ